MGGQQREECVSHFDSTGVDYTQEQEAAGCYVCDVTTSEATHIQEMVRTVRSAPPPTP